MALTTTTASSLRRPTVGGPGLAAGLGLAGWAVVVAWSASPWRRYLHHDGLLESALPAGATVAAFVAGWVVMLAAMMLPTTHPLVRLFTGLVAARADRRRLTALLLAGYVGVWTAAGLAAFAGDVGVHALVDAVPALGDRTWLLATGVLAGAGAYQLSALKERCLTRCRNPRTVLLLRWRGRAPASEAFTIGARHGFDCLSCCWALMLVLFALGAGGVVWMLAVGGAMAAEKLAPGGGALRRPIGAMLLAAALAVAVVNL